MIPKSLIKLNFQWEQNFAGINLKIGKQAIVKFPQNELSERQVRYDTMCTFWEFVLEKRFRLVDMAKMLMI